MVCRTFLADPPMKRNEVELMFHMSCQHDREQYHHVWEAFWRYARHYAKAVKSCSVYRNSLGSLLDCDSIAWGPQLHDDFCARFRGLAVVSEDVRRIDEAAALWAYCDGMPVANESDRLRALAWKSAFWCRYSRLLLAAMCRARQINIPSNILNGIERNWRLDALATMKHEQGV